jgi:hypothetical protein
MLTVSSLLLLLLMLQAKHLLVDWCWQPEYELQNKGTYGHFGGIRHAGKNAIGTGLCLLPFFGVVGALIGTVLDFVIHYHVDYTKMNINRLKGWGPTTHAKFWYLTGLDQFLHQATYILIIWLLI